MHLTLILLAVTIAYFSRCRGLVSAADWSIRWRQTLSAFLLPPLLLLTTAIAVLCMGTQGKMLGLPVGWIGYLLAVSCLGTAVGLLLWLGWQAERSLRQIQAYPTQSFPTQSCPTQSFDKAIGHVLDTPRLFAAQVGFWQPKLVVSQGLLAQLTPTQLAAVLTHEQAHTHYRDTFWFFWLGWLRHLTGWLPHTAALWQELLLLRELRADRWAAQRVDPLLLAETLLLTVKDGAIAPDYCAAFSAAAPPIRLEERIEALLDEPIAAPPIRWFSLTPLLALIPLLTLLIHR